MFHSQVDGWIHHKGEVLYHFFKASLQLLLEM